jgi:hypothetical protein
MKEDKDCVIFSTGGLYDWVSWLKLNIVNSRVEVHLCDESDKSSTVLKKYYWNKIDINCDGTKVNLYINGKKEKQFDLDFINNNNYKTPGLWFNRNSTGTSSRWMESKFYLNDFKFRNVVKTQSEIETAYIDERSRYEY